MSCIQKSKQTKPNFMISEEKSNRPFSYVKFLQKLKFDFYPESTEWMMARTEIMMSRMKWMAVSSPRAVGFDVQRAGLQLLSFRAM